MWNTVNEETEKKLHCPHCDAELERINYQARTSGTEWGRVSVYVEGEDSIQTDDYYSDDSETDDTYDYEYECPECGHSLDNISNLIIKIDGNKEDKEEDEDEKPKFEPRITEVEPNIIESISPVDICIAGRINISNIFNCEHCDYKLITDENITICPNCKHEK